MPEASEASPPQPLDVALSELGFVRNPELMSLQNKIKSIPCHPDLDPKQDPALSHLDAFHQMGESVVNQAIESGADPLSALLGKMVATMEMYRASGRVRRYKAEVFDLLTFAVHSGKDSEIVKLIKGGLLDEAIVTQWRED